jgi:hypothetical protein
VLRKIVMVLAVALVVAAVIESLPDVKRYLEMRKM